MDQAIFRLIPVVIRNCLKDIKFPTSKGDQLRDYIYINDVVNILIRSIIIKNINGQIFNFFSGSPILVKKIINKFVKNL